MNVLCQGPPFFAGKPILDRYEGVHDIRTIAAIYEYGAEGTDYRYDLAQDTIHDIFGRFEPDWKPDLFLLWCPEEHVPPRRIEECPVPTAAVVSDWNFIYPRIWNNLARYDVAVCDFPGSKSLGDDLMTPRYFGPIYSHLSDVHRPLVDEPDYDVVYVGALNHKVRPNRARYLARLARLKDRYRILLAGGFRGDDYVKALGRGRIVFNYGARGAINLRVFEAMACGGVQFMEESNGEAQHNFEDGREIVFYNEENFEARIAYYLDHPDEAAGIVKHARAAAHRFAGENRLDPLIEWCLEQPSGGRLFRQLPPREQAFHEVLQYSGSCVPIVGQLERGLMTEFVQGARNEARGLTLMAAYSLTPVLHLYMPCDNEEELKAPCRQALLLAQELAPDSAPYAMNAAWACAWCNDLDGERRYLEHALAADSIEGAELRIVDINDTFWLHWMQCVAEKRPKLADLHAEAENRLGRLDALAGRPAEAGRRIERSLELRPDQPGIRFLLGEIRYAAGDLNAARELVQAHVEEAPFDDGANGLLHEILVKLGRDAEAQALAADAWQLHEAFETGD